MFDDASGMTTRVAFGVGNQVSGLYSPDGRSVVFSWDAKGAFELYRQEIGAADGPSPVVENNIWKFPESWSRDGRFVSYTQSEPGKPKDIWIVPMTGNSRPFPFAKTPAEEWGSAFSPDGRFLAYVSDESGSPEVFIRTFPSSPARWQVSAGGGIAPIWRGDGKELYYLSPNLSLVAVPIAATAGGLQPGAAQTLFKDPGLRLPSVWTGNPLAVSADGQRFLAILQSGQGESSPIVVRTGARP
jgi:Tol biopolymer transport system component